MDPRPFSSPRKRTAVHFIRSRGFERGMSFLKKMKDKTEEAAKKGVEVGKEAGEKGVDVGKKGVKKTDEAVRGKDD